jgi:hypothetical protein
MGGPSGTSESTTGGTSGSTTTPGGTSK